MYFVFDFILTENLIKLNFINNINEKINQNIFLKDRFFSECIVK